MLLSMIVGIIAIYMVIVDSDAIVYNRHVVVSYLIGIRCMQVMLFGEHLR